MHIIFTFYIFVERGGQREENQCEKETWICCLPHLSWPGIDPTTWVCVLPGNRTVTFWCGTMLQPTGPHQPGHEYFVFQRNLIFMMKLHKGRIFIRYAQCLMQSRYTNTVNSLMWCVLFALVRLGITIEKENTCMGLNVKRSECPPSVLTWLSHVWWTRASFSASQRSFPEVTDVNMEEEVECSHTWDVVEGWIYVRNWVMSLNITTKANLWLLVRGFS